jgi:hypothetical protein
LYRDGDTVVHSIDELSQDPNHLELERVFFFRGRIW